MQFVGKNSGIVYTLVQMPSGYHGQPYWTYTFEQEYRGRQVTMYATHCYLSEQHDTPERAIAVCQSRDPAPSASAAAPAAPVAAKYAPVGDVLAARHLHPGQPQRCKCCGEVSGRFTTLPAAMNTCDDCA